MERDVRRNAGWAAIALRRADSRHHNAWLGRIGYAAIPFLAAGSVGRGLARIARLRRDYGLRWSDVPLAAALAVGMTRYEVEGMVTALRGRDVVDTAYR
jgi:hypothetical protein